MKCASMSPFFPDGGYGDAMAYFEKNWQNDGNCYPVKWQTPYSVYTRDDYKRCICDNFGNGEASCPQAKEEEEVLPTIMDPEEAFAEIQKKPHHSEDEKSRTTYQVDRSLDYIQDKLVQMHTILKNNQK